MAKAPNPPSYRKRPPSSRATVREASCGDGSVQSQDRALPPWTAWWPTGVASGTFVDVSPSPGWSASEGTVSPGISRSLTVHLTPQRTRGPVTPRPSAPPGPLPPRPRGADAPRSTPSFPIMLWLVSSLKPSGATCRQTRHPRGARGSFTRDVGWFIPRGPGEAGGTVGRWQRLRMRQTGHGGSPAPTPQPSWPEAGGQRHGPGRVAPAALPWEEAPNSERQGPLQMGVEDTGVAPHALIPTPSPCAPSIDKKPYICSRRH